MTDPITYAERYARMLQTLDTAIETAARVERGLDAAIDALDRVQERLATMVAR